MIRKDKILNMDYHVSLKLILKNRLGEALIMKAPDNTALAGYYDLPGGRINRKEVALSLKKIIEREVGEEIGAKVKFTLKEYPVAVGRHVYYSKRYQRDQHLIWIIFEAKYISGKVNISSEHKEYVWVKLTKRNYKRYFTAGPLRGVHNYLFHKLI